MISINMSIFQELLKFSNILFQLMLIKAINSRAYLFLLSRHHLCSLKNPPSTSNLTEGAQKAIMSVKIMQLIVESKIPSSFQGQSLAQEILSLKDTIADYKIKKQVQQTFFKMFKGGIHLSSKVYTQERIKDARQGQQKIFFGPNQDNRKFIFFPTCLTTKPMFEILLQTYQQESQKKRDVIVTGGFGIGKTVSIILYSQLSRYIHEYHLKFIETNEKQQQKQVLSQQQKDLIKEYKKLIAQKLLFIVPKCFYWSIKSNIDLKSQLSIEEVILQQVGEVSEEKRKQLRETIKFGNIQSFPLKLQSLYPKVHLKVVADQLNVLCRFMTEYNSHQAKGRNGTLRDRMIIVDGESRVETVDEQELQQIQRNVVMTFLMNSLSHYRKCGHNTVFFSSVNLERELLLGSTPEKKGIQIYGPNWHEIPFERTIQFQDLLREVPGANIIFWQFFYFQIERRLQQLKASKEKLAKIKKAFFDKCEQSNAQVNSYFRLVYIRIFFKERNELLPNILLIKEQQLPQSLRKIIESFRQYCVQNTIIKFNKFLNKNNKSEKSQKINFLLRLYQNALNCFDQEEEKDKQNQKANMKKKYVKIEAILLEKFLEKYIQSYSSSGNVEYGMDLEFFAFKHLNQNQLSLLLPPRQAMEVLYNVLFPNISQLVPFGRYFQQYVEAYQAPRGFMMKLTFLQCLIENVKVKYVQQSFPKQSKKNKTKQFIIWEKTKFTSLTPLPTPVKGSKISDLPKSNSFEGCFQNLLDISKQMPGKHFVGIPYKIVDKKNVFDDKSPTIDFAIGCYDKNKDVFNLSSFDLTIGKTLSDKQQKAINLLQNLLKEEQRANITHTILCPKSAIPKIPSSTISNSNLSIQYADIYKVNFQHESVLAGERVHIHKQLVKIYQNLQQESERRKENQ